MMIFDLSLTERKIGALFGGVRLHLEIGNKPHLDQLVLDRLLKHFITFTFLVGLRRCSRVVESCIDKSLVAIDWSILIFEYLVRHIIIIIIKSSHYTPSTLLNKILQIDFKWYLVQRFQGVSGRLFQGNGKLRKVMK